MSREDYIKSLLERDLALTEEWNPAFEGLMKGTFPPSDYRQKLPGWEAEQASIKRGLDSLGVNILELKAGTAPNLLGGGGPRGTDHE